MKYWTMLKEIAGDKLLINYISPSKKAWDKYLKEPIKMSDFFRLLVLIKFGGIYLDADLLFIKSHEEFFKGPDMKNKLTIAIESSCSLANGFMITEPNNKVLLRWLQEYKKFDNFHMGTFSVMKAWSLWNAYPNEFNAVQSTMVRPNWREIDLLGKFFNWKKSFNVHLSLRSLPKVLHPGVNLKDKNSVPEILTEMSDIDCMENSLGEMFRFVVYGDEAIC